MCWRDKLCTDQFQGVCWIAAMSSEKASYVMLYLHTGPIVIFDDVCFVFLGTVQMSCFQQVMKIPLFASPNIMNIFLCYNFDVDKRQRLTTCQPPTSMQVNTLHALPHSLEIFQLPLEDANHICV